MEAGASFVCVLAGRLHDQGHDALSLTEQIVSIVERDHYPAKVMFSSVRHAEHVRQAALAGAHVCTVPWPVLERLADNTLTSKGTVTFLEDTRLMTMRVADVMRERNPVCSDSDTVVAALAEMTESGTGAVSVVDSEGRFLGVFTDGDIRRRLQREGPGFLNDSMANAGYTTSPVTIGPDELLQQAQELLREHRIDNLVVIKDNEPVGILDIQDLMGPETQQ